MIFSRRVSISNRNISSRCWSYFLKQLQEIISLIIFFYVGDLKELGVFRDYETYDTYETSFQAGKTGDFERLGFGGFRRCAYETDNF